MAGPGGIDTGVKAAVRVLPDTSKFLPSLEKYIKRVERALRIEIPVTLDPDGIKAQTEKIREQVQGVPVRVPVQAKVDEFSRQVRASVAQVSRDVEASIPITPEGEAFRKELATQIEAVEASLRVEVPVDPAEAAQFRRKVAEQVKAVQALTRDVPVEVPVYPSGLAGLVARLRAMTREAEAATPPIELRTSVDRSKAGLISSLAGTVNELVSQTAAVGRILLTWGPPIIAAGAGLVAIASAAAVLAPLAVGFGVAIGVVSASMDRLKKQFAPVETAIKALQKPISDTFTKGFGPLAKSIATDLIPQLQSGLDGVAQVMNQAATSVLEFTSSAKGIALIKTLFDGLGPALKPLAAAVAPLTKALLQISVAALPGLKLLSQGIANVVLNFSDFINKASKSGKLAAGISKAITGTGKILSGLGDFLGPLFSGLAMIGPSVLSGLGSAFTAVGKSISSVILTVRGLGTSVSAAGQSLAPFKALVGSAFSAIAGQVEQAVASIRQLAPSFAPFLAVLASVATYISSSLGPAFTALRAALQPVINGFQQFLVAIGPQLQPTFLALKTVMDTIGPTIANLGLQIGSVLGPGLSQIGLIIGQQLLPAFQAILPVVTPVANFLIKVIGSSVVGALKGAISVIKGLLVVISGIFNTFAAIFTGDWKRAWLGIRQVFTGAFTAILGAIRVFLNVGVLRLFRTGIQATLAVFRTFGTGLVALGRTALSLLRAVVSAGFNAVVAVAKAAPGRIIGALKSLAGGLRSLAANALRQFQSAISAGISGVLRIVGSIPGKIISALGDLSGLLYDAGAKLIQGLINGIQSKIGAVGGAMKGVASKVKGFLPGSPVKEGPLTSWNNGGAGKRLMGLLAQGINAASSDPVNAVRRVTVRAADAVVNLGKLIGTKYATGLVSSADKVKKAGQDLVAQVNKAIQDYRDDKTGLSAKIDRETAAVRKAQTRYNRAVADYRADKTLSNARSKTDAKKALAEAQARLAADSRTYDALEVAYARIDTLATSAKARGALVNLVKVEGAKLQQLAVQREKNAARLENANTKLTDAIKVRDDYARSIADAIRSYGGIIAQADEGQVLTASQVVSQLSAKVVAIDDFRRSLDRLKAQGLSDAALKQLVDAGVDAGAATAQALADGGQAAIAQVNALTKTIGSSADIIGTTYAAKFFQAGVDIAQGIVNGIAAKQKALDDSADRLADSLVRRVKSKLGIKSPSVVMAGIGGMIGRGLAEGIDASRALVERATDRLTAAATPTGVSLGESSASGPFGAGASITVNTYNPAPETPSETTTRTMRRLVLLGVSA